MSRAAKVIDQDGGEVDRIAALQTEVLDDIDGPVLVELVPGQSVRVLPPKMWRVSSLSAMRAGDFEGWAAKALASTDDFEVFMDVDPTLEQVEQFMKNLNAASGEGNSKTSSLSSRRSKSSRTR
jgi:hypothetical protein